MLNNKALSKYLKLYAEPISQYISTYVDNLSVPLNRQFCLVIPAYKEDYAFIKRLQAHCQAHNTLLILVLNEPENDKDNGQNQQLIKQLFNCYQYNDSTTEHTDKQAILLSQPNQALQILLIRQLGPAALPIKQGVGLARKIGADCAAALIQQGSIKQPWIFSSDADAHLPDNYFELPAISAPASGNTQQNSAYVYNFHHRISNNSVGQATEIYEQQIKYYQAQLEQAGSPYAFFTLGSCIAISMTHYCMVRGFPKRAAAEDFYLLNKLAKVGKISTLPTISISIDARISDRVPFGTGPAVREIVDKLALNTDIYYYNPRIFADLRLLLSSIDMIWQNLCGNIGCLDGLPLGISKALTTAGFEQFAKIRFKQDKDLAQFEKSFHLWFDAFQTLKCVRRMQAADYPDTSFSPTKALSSL